ncbi:MAG: hypothetical protein WCF23_20770, partial [Candidatus Nitrosopolaris sp.]
GLIDETYYSGYQKSKRVYSLIPCMCTLGSCFFVHYDVFGEGKTSIAFIAPGTFCNIKAILS